jgi:two-component system, LytTR family, response regulator
VKNRLRVVIADDERPARSLLRSMLEGFDDVEIVGEALDGAEAVVLINQTAPDLALLDLQMPELHGIDVVRTLPRSSMPMIAFVTAYDEFAIRAFELNAVDYLLKPVESVRLRETLNRAIDRLERADLREEASANVEAAADEYEEGSAHPPLTRIPVRRREEIVFLPVEQIASAVADGELLQLTTRRNERHTISYRLKDLEHRLDPERFIRLGRGTLISVDLIERVHPMPGGTYMVTLANGQQFQTSRIHSRIFRDKLLKL